MKKQRMICENFDDGKAFCSKGRLYFWWMCKSGNILGPWKQKEEPIYRADGGHGMVLRGVDGILRLAIHTPNDTPNERPVFLPVRETEDGLEIMN
jgi:hypothetical protein